MSLSASKLCKELLKAPTELIPEPVTRAILKALIDSVSEQTSAIDQIGSALYRIEQKLDQMDQKLDQTIDAPFKNGLHFLTAADAIRNPLLRQKHIESALAQFIDASNKTAALDAKGFSMLYIGVCYLLLNEPIVALHMYEQAYQTGWDYESGWESSSREIERTPERNYEYDIFGFIDNDSGPRLPIPIISLYPREMFYINPIRRGIARSRKFIDDLAGANEIPNSPPIVSPIPERMRFFDQNFLIPLRELLRSNSSTLPLIRLGTLSPVEKRVQELRSQIKARRTGPPEQRD